MQQLALLLCVVVTSLLGGAHCVTSHKDGGPQKLMLILLDGFRWDYVEKYNLTNFKRFYSNGARVQSMESVFPTLSFPNYYSIATGLYAENHQMVGNNMYDRETGQFFILDHNPDHLKRHWWEGAWPIWASVENQGKRAYMFRWRGPEVPIHGIHPTWYIPYAGIPTTDEFKDAMRDGLTVLANGSADFVGIYDENVDHFGHVSGPDSSTLGAILVGIDGIVGNLLDKLEGLKASERVNLMIVSDHGMTNIDRSRVINITSILTSDLYTTVTEENAVTNIFLSDPKLQDTVYGLLHDVSPHMAVYKREDVPDRYHYKHGNLVPGIVCIADLGWSILHPLKPDFFTNKETGLDAKGTHGYDNALMDMRGIFYGMGPHFKAGASVKSIRSVDLYNVMCGILGITPMPNNGTIQHVSPLLATSGASSTFCLQTLMHNPITALHLFIAMIRMFNNRVI